MTAIINRFKRIKSLLRDTDYIDSHVISLVQVECDIAIGEILHDSYKNSTPLAPEQIFSCDEIMKLNGTVMGMSMEDIMKFVKIIESKHGIK